MTKSPRYQWSTCMKALFAVLLLSLPAVVALDSADEQCDSNDKQCKEEPPFCGVYMAPSTVMESNMGIYTSQDLKEGDAVNFPEIAIPLLFREWGIHPNSTNPDGQLWERYIWEGNLMNIESKNESDPKDAGSVFVPGVGCTVNSMLDMHNIYSASSSRYDTAGIHRSLHPSAGSFTPYHGAITTARHDIPAGSELFAAYGDDWIPWIPNAVVSNNETMDQGEEFMSIYKQWMEQHASMPNELKEGLWNFTSRNFPYNSRVLNVLPRTEWRQVEQAFKSAAAAADGGIVRHFILNNGKRDLQWLRENGKCQDHLVPGRSTLKLAGMGAFANRFLPKGTVVGYAPLVHIGKNAENLLKITYNESGGYYYEQQDLVINYSFGHANSTLVLTPYGGMVSYINHNATLANVKVQWPATDLVAHKREWLSKSIDFLANTQSKIGLSFDYVATRDIQQGEEVFLDYGNEWEEAWKEHVQNYQPGDANYVHSSQFQLKDGILRTLDELKTDPYPPNLHTVCVGDNYRKVGNNYMWTNNSGKLLVKCRVLERNGNLYTVERELPDNAEKTITVHEVPLSKHGIQLVDKVRSADWHLPTAFRHKMGIPDDIFPEGWKNKK